VRGAAGVQGKPGVQGEKGPRGEPGPAGQLPSLEQVMPWLHLVFDAYEDYKRKREQEAIELLETAAREASTHAALVEHASDDVFEEDEDEHHGKKDKKHKHKHKKKDKK
jgi:hypothetical protein